MDFPISSKEGHRLLFNWLSSMLSHEDVMAIANADYGLDLTEHAEAIAAIIRTGEIRSPLEWIPSEVLCLTRWGDPDDEPENERTKEHLRRMFSCAVLLVDSIQGGWHMGTNSTIAAFVESSIALGGETPEMSAHLIAGVAQCLSQEEPDEAPFLGLAFLSLAMTSPRTWNDANLLSVAEWVMKKEDEIASPWRDSLGLGHDHPWLLGEPGTLMREDVWKKIGLGLKLRATSARRSDALRETAELIGAMME